MATASALVYKEAGNPLEVLSLEKNEMQAPGKGEVLLQLLAAPVNPSDILTIRGMYPLQPSHGIPGHEGLFKVAELGEGVTSLKKGDRVVPLTPAAGTWRTHIVAKADDWHPVREDLPLEAAAALVVNPGTAIGLLEDFEKLEKGDVVVQNGGNSSVGELIAQLTSQMGVKLISVVRDRKNWDEVAANLKKLGADYVVRPDDLASFIKEQNIPAPKLALDCAAGESQVQLLNTLAPKGTLVNYGSMTGERISASAVDLIMKQVKVCGFWVHAKMKDDRKTAIKLLDHFADVMIKKNLKYDAELVDFESGWKDVLDDVVSGAGRSKKYMLTLK